MICDIRDMIGNILKHGQFINKFKIVPRVFFNFLIRVSKNINIMLMIELWQGIK